MLLSCLDWCDYLIGLWDFLVFVVMIWVIMGLLGVILVMEIIGVSFIDVVFEFVSVLIIIGVIILDNLDFCLRVFLMYW